MRSLPSLLVVLLLLVAIALSAPSNEGSTDDQNESDNVNQQEDSKIPPDFIEEPPQSIDSAGN